MEVPVEDLGAPESWEVADLDETMSRLMLSSKDSRPCSSVSDQADDASVFSAPASIAGSSAVSSTGGKGVLEDAINQVDQFLREALQNPRERLSILRIEQDVEMFIRDPARKQLEFQQLPTSYLRLAAHRVAQHYSLQSMVLLDNSLPDGSGCKIIVSKTPECRLPVIRLADVPVNLQPEDSSVVKVAIKQRPQKKSQIVISATSHPSKTNSAKSVEERKEEYNRARARIFSSNGNCSGTILKQGSDTRVMENSPQGSFGMPRLEEKSAPGVSEVNAIVARGLIDSSAGSSGSARSRAEREPIGRHRPNNKVAIFRDREIDRKDPDYDRSYERYMQRFDPGFGFSGGPYSVQPMYTPALNYNTEFPQLASAHRSQISSEHQRIPLPQHHLPSLWATPSTPVGIGYGRPETMMNPFTNYVGAHSASAIYMHSSQFQRPAMPFVHSHEHLHQTFLQSHQQQSDGAFGLARPR